MGIPKYPKHIPVTILPSNPIFQSSYKLNLHIHSKAHRLWRHCNAWHPQQLTNGVHPFTPTLHIKFHPDGCSTSLSIMPNCEPFTTCLHGRVSKLRAPRIPNVSFCRLDISTSPFQETTLGILMPFRWFRPRRDVQGGPVYRYQNLVCDDTINLTQGAKVRVFICRHAKHKCVNYM